MENIGANADGSLGCATFVRCFGTTGLTPDAQVLKASDDGWL